jgi:hypothetical protein
LLVFIRFKINYMKTVVQQEILLVTNSTLSKRQLCETGTRNSIKHLSETEQLEEACWNGLLHEILPEVIEKSSAGNQLPLWQIRHGTSLLEIELGDPIPFFKGECSINPHNFLKKIFWN